MTHNELRAVIADIIACEWKGGSSISDGAALAGLSDDEWTAERILRVIAEEQAGEVLFPEEAELAIGWFRDLADQYDVAIPGEKSSGAQRSLTEAWFKDKELALLDKLRRIAATKKVAS